MGYGRLIGGWISRRTRRDGQALLLAVFLGLTLIITIPLIVYLNRMDSSHQESVRRRAEARNVAMEGLTIAINRLSGTQLTWDNARNNNFNLAAECNSGTLYSSPGGGTFQLACDISSGVVVAGKSIQRQPYQVRVLSTALARGANGNLVPTRRVEAFLSQRTVGIDLTTGLHTGAALVLVTTPTLATGATLDVQWGPIVCFDTHTFQLKGNMDLVGSGSNRTPGYPRKFSVGPIVGGTLNGSVAYFPRASTYTTSGLTTDSKEYWAFVSARLPPMVDTATYRMRAQAETGLPTFTGCSNSGGDYDCTAGGSFSGTSTTDITGSTVIFVTGNLALSNIVWDLGLGGGLVVDGDLTLGSSRNNGLGQIRVPPMAAEEYAYLDANDSAIDCKGDVAKGLTQPAPTCTTANHKPQIHGFLYVRGNLIVNDDWTIQGTVFVGNLQADPPYGGLSIAANKRLTIYYDDIVNHNIHVYTGDGNRIVVQPDLVHDVPTD